MPLERKSPPKSPSEPIPCKVCDVGFLALRSRDGGFFAGVGAIMAALSAFGFLATVPDVWSLVAASPKNPSIVVGGAAQVVTAEMVACLGVFAIGRAIMSARPMLRCNNCRATIDAS